MCFMQSKPDIGKPVTLHLVMDVALPDGTMPSAEMRLHGPQVLVYASMSAAIVMFAKRVGVAPAAVSYSQTWED
jgi:hypothetical protein